MRLLRRGSAMAMDLDFSEMLTFISITVILHGSLVIFWSIFFGIIAKFNLFPDSKIQNMKPSKLSNPDIYKCIKHITLLHVVMQPLGLPGFYYVMKLRGMRFGSPGPEISELLLHIPIFFVIEDTLFYWLHRLLHHYPFLYKHIHKFHHSYHQPISLAAEYSHPLDYFLTGSIPTFAGAVLMGSHVWTYYIWLTIRLTESQDGHCGYDLWFMPFRYFPFRPGAQVHDYHHSHNKGNYSSLFNYWDKLCGTNLSFNEYQKEELKKDKKH